MHTVTLYKNNSVPNRIDKRITQVAQVRGALMEDTNEKEVTLRIQLSLGELDARRFNYFRVFGNYYFVSDVTYQGEGIHLLHGTIDLLETFKENIKALHVIATRSQSHGSAEVDDAGRILTVSKERVAITFPNQLNLSEAGGGYVAVTSQDKWAE